MEQAAFHLPDFGVPDYRQPSLERVDLTQPNFALPDPALSDLQRVGDAPQWPPDLDHPASMDPDPALPDLLQPEQPDVLSYPDANTHALAQPECAPEVVMQQRPGELDPSAQTLLLDSPDEAALPPRLAYPQLYTNDDQMSRRTRHFAMQELGLAQSASEHYAE